MQAVLLTAWPTPAASKVSRNCSSAGSTASMEVEEFAFRLNEGNCNVYMLDRIEAMLAWTVGVQLKFTSREHNL